MNRPVKPLILCVDDEPHVVEGLALILRKDYEVHTATSAEQALHKLRDVTNLAVVISDMRMPKMDGATFLHQAMLRRPDAARILLTGQADRDEAIRAVNEGQIFRFLVKPCPSDQLKAAIDAGVIHYRLHQAERSILRETLIGCINALVEVLSIANPVAFGRAGLIKRRAMEFAAWHGTPDFWQLEAAALLSQLGYAALAPALVDKVYHGAALSAGEQAQVDAIPDMANRLLEHIPRLEPVIQILAALKWNDAQLMALGEGTVGVATRILGLILEYDALIARGDSHDTACEKLRARAARYGPKLLENLDACAWTAQAREPHAEVQLQHVEPGMILLQELRNAVGVLITPKGFEVTRTFIDRLSNIAPELLGSTIRVGRIEAREAATEKD
jgi:FixJ family two-component response regulator